MTWLELYEIARERSPFYRDLFVNRPTVLSDLPILDQSAFWAANHLQNNRVLTGPMDDGIVYKSGGTTGNPKFSVFSRDEWKRFTEAFGWGLNQGGMVRGDRVANLFYVGELYASFLFISASVAAAPESALILPIAGATGPQEMMGLLVELGADVLAGAPTTIVGVAAAFEKAGGTRPAIRKILFGGETMYADQRIYLEKIFPGVRITSIGYASVDAGLLGYVDENCLPGEHRCFEEATMELVDEETDELIEESDRPGKLILTNLQRTLMPIIRYPVGDRAVWTEPVDTPHRRFRLLGRSEEGARVGPATLYYEDITEVLTPFAAALSIQGFQLLLGHEGLRDRVTLRIAAANREAARSQSTSVVAALLDQRPMLADLYGEGMIHEPSIEWVDRDELIVNRRTGKVRRIIDHRLVSK